MALRIGKDLTRHAMRTSLSNIGTEANANDMWAAVSKSTGRQQESTVSADSLMYIARSSTCITQWLVIQILDRLRALLPPDLMAFPPAWFLRLIGAPLFCRPVTHLFNLSLVTSMYAPRQQWKQLWPILKSFPESTR